MKPVLVLTGFSLLATPVVAVLVIATTGGKPASVHSYAAPRTPWGEPDLQGAYTNRDERLTPMERPSGFAERRLDDITAEELARLNRQRAERMRVHDLEPVYEEPVANGGQAWLVVDPPSGSIPAWTEAARRRAVARAERLRHDSASRPWAAADLFTRCISRGLPGSMLPLAYGSVYEIVQAPGVVAITYEMINEARVIAVSAEPHVGKAIRSYMGDARGRFVGDSLVVETTNFNDAVPYRGSSSGLRLVERFTPVAPDHVEWFVTLHDAETWPRPWSFVMTLTKTVERPLEFACHEGNLAVRHLLTGLRSAGQ